jgi:hypothetical protein
MMQLGWYSGPTIPGFLLPFLIPQTFPYSSITQGWYSSPLVAGVPAGLSRTPPHEIKKENIIKRTSLIFINFLGVDPGLRTNTENTEKCRIFLNKMAASRLDNYIYYCLSDIMYLILGASANDERFQFELSYGPW